MKRYSEKERIDFISEHARSGLSVAAFCQQHGMSQVSLSSWRKRYGCQAATSASPAEQWLPVVLKDADPPAPPLAGHRYVLSSSGVKLEVPRGFDPQEVRCLWQLMHLSPEAAS